MNDTIDYENEIQNDFERLDRVSNKAENLKLTVINKLASVVDELAIDPNNDKPRDIEAKIGIVNSYVSLLDSYEKQVQNVAKIKQKHIDDETSDNVQKLVTKLLLSIKDNTNPTSTIKDVKDDNILDEKIIDNDIQITKGELETNSKVDIMKEIKDDS